MEILNFCCNKLKREIESGQIVLDSSMQSIHVNGCCGGGCYVLTDLWFCPFCGREIEKLKVTKT